MKKENKYPIYGIMIGAGVGMAVSLVQQYIDLKRQGLPYWQNLNVNKLRNYGMTGGGLGLLGGYGFYKWNFKNESKKSFDSNKHVGGVLKLNKVSDNPVFLEAKNTRDEIRDLLFHKYENQLAGRIVDWGSTARGTATMNCDFDLLVPYQRFSFSSLEEMYDDLHGTLKDNFSDFKIRKQKHSIGMKRTIEGQEIQFDIVPGREINDYRIDKEVNLFVKGGLFKNSTRIKTNVDAARELTINRPREREVVKLMKVYRDRYGFEVKSTFIQHMVMEAFEMEPPVSSSAANLKYAMKYLSENMTYSRIVDPGNTNNVISEGVDSYSRSLMAESLESDLKKLENNKSYLKEIFPL